MKTIKFWKTSDEYGFLSNFYNAPFELRGVKFTTSEHFFQAYKYVNNPRYFEIIRNAKTPKEAATFGRNKLLPLREDWESVKEDVMTEALYLKFEQNLVLRTKLIETGDAELIEDSPYDFYWGCGEDGSGRNRLGKLLMNLRKHIRGIPTD